MPRRHRDYVLPLLQAWVEGNGCCPPQAPEGAVTSAARRWARHTGVAMRRAAPHPRPWEGPVMSFEGLFMSTAPDRGPAVDWAAATPATILQDINAALASYPRPAARP